MRSHLGFPSGHTITYRGSFAAIGEKGFTAG